MQATRGIPLASVAAVTLNAFSNGSRSASVRTAPVAVAADHI